MPSMRLGWARPVRGFFRSCWKLWMHFCMRCVASALMSLIMAYRSFAWRMSVVAYQRTDILAAHNPRQVAGIVQVEDPQGNVVVAAQDDGGAIHHAEPVVEHTFAAVPVIACGGGVLHRVVRLHAVDLGGLEQQVGAHLDGPQ